MFPPKYREIFIRKYCIFQKLDHLACNLIQGLKRILIQPVIKLRLSDTRFKATS